MPLATPARRRDGLDVKLDEQLLHLLHREDDLPEGLDIGRHAPVEEHIGRHLRLGFRAAHKRDNRVKGVR